MITSTLHPRIFPAKLLLFGEHVLLLGASALAVPVNIFGGRWAWGEDRDRHHIRLLQFARGQALRAVEIINTKAFESDLEAGLFFQSDIPTGYGLGSSGLCAAIYDRYANAKTEELSALKSIFAVMEGFFHGNSSGIDPLTSYLEAPVLIQNKSEVQQVSPPAWAEKMPTVFLIDSRLPRRTGALVEWFLTQNREPGFSTKLLDEYLPVHEAVMQGWLTADEDLFWPNLRRVSAFQFENFAPMVPHTLKDFWEKSFEHQDFTLKICGAGGGGFVLGFARNAEAAQALSAQFHIVFPFA